jgi:hypothetical protein
MGTPRSSIDSDAAQGREAADARSYRSISTVGPDALDGYSGRTKAWAQGYGRRMAADPIASLVHRYADAVVRYDGDQWGATWAPDAHWELGPGRRVEGREAIVDLWHKAMGGFIAVSQNVMNGSYELDEAAGTGAGRWYIIEHYHRRTDPASGDDGKGKLLAYYDDTYTLVDGEWLFASRFLVPQYSGPVDMSGDFLNAR